MPYKRKKMSNPSDRTTIIATEIVCRELQKNRIINPVICNREVHTIVQFV